MRKVDPDNEDLLNQPPHHMSHWDEKVFRSLEHLLPLRVISAHCEPLASYHISWMLNGYLRSVLAPLGSTLPRLLINRYTEKRRKAPSFSYGDIRRILFYQAESVIKWNHESHRSQAKGHTGAISVSGRSHPYRTVCAQQVSAVLDGQPWCGQE
jgi:hypothetical protein